MAKYTIELKDVIKLGYDIFGFKYDFYDESKRLKFERDFIRHFYFREIGSSSVEEFIHNLEDKMVTIFPYYNELFKANQIEYDVLNSYRLTETLETSRDTKGVVSGVSSSVGSAFDSQSTSSTNHHSAEVESESETNVNGTRTKNETSESSATNSGEREKTLTSKIDNSSSGTTSETIKETNSGTTSETVSETSEGTSNTINKYLDTPQGKVNLNTTDYLTNLTQNDTTDSKTVGTTKTGETENSINRTVTGSSSSEGESNGSQSENETHTETSESNSEAIGSEVENSKAVANASETNTSNSEVSATFEGEQKTTLDNNTRTNNNEVVTEKHTLTRIGNIGVSPDALDIMKHLELQKIVKAIEKLFFDECEDLFMLVW